MIYWIGYFLFNLIGLIIFPRKVIGRENLPKDTNFLVASNHISNLDPFIVGTSCKRRFSYIAKRELFRNKIGSFILKSLHAFPINRETSDLGAMRLTLKKLREGESIVLFPEGTRIKENQKIQLGIAFLAVKSGLPVVPVFLQGTDHVLIPNKKLPRRAHVTVKIGKPVEFNPEAPYQEIADIIMKSVYLLQ